MGDFTAFESVSFTAHLAFLCPAASIGFGLGHMATMTSSSANKWLVADDGTAGFQLPLCKAWIAPCCFVEPQVQTKPQVECPDRNPTGYDAMSHLNRAVAKVEDAQAAI